MRERQEADEKRIVFLEFFAASAILSILVLVLYMVFSYRPV